MSDEPSPRVRPRVLRLYLDKCVHLSILPVLQAHSCDVLVASSFGSTELSDEAQLLLSTELGRLLVTHNQRHYRLLHRRFVRENRRHAGIILLPQTLPFARLTVRAGLLVEHLSHTKARVLQLFSSYFPGAIFSRG